MSTRALLLAAYGPVALATNFPAEMQVQREEWASILHKMSIATATPALKHVTHLPPYVGAPHKVFTRAWWQTELSTDVVAAWKRIFPEQHWAEAVCQMVAGGGVEDVRELWKALKGNGMAQLCLVLASHPLLNVFHGTHRAPQSGALWSSTACTAVHGIRAQAEVCRALWTQRSAAPSTELAAAGVAAFGSWEKWATTRCQSLFGDNIDDADCREWTARLDVDPLELGDGDFVHFMPDANLMRDAAPAALGGLDWRCCCSKGATTTASCLVPLWLHAALWVREREAEVRAMPKAATSWALDANAIPHPPSTRQRPRWELVCRSLQGSSSDTITGPLVPQVGARNFRWGAHQMPYALDTSAALQPVLATDGRGKSSVDMRTAVMQSVNVEDARVTSMWAVQDIYQMASIRVQLCLWARACPDLARQPHSFGVVRVDDAVWWGLLSADGQEYAPLPLHGVVVVPMAIRKHMPATLLWAVTADDTRKHTIGGSDIATLCQHLEGATSVREGVGACWAQQPASVAEPTWTLLEAGKTRDTRFFQTAEEARTYTRLWSDISDLNEHPVRGSAEPVTVVCMQQ